MKNIGILGCGWLGFPLAQALVREGFTVSGTTRSSNMLATFSQANITHYTYQLGDAIPAKFKNELELLIIAFPVSTKISEQQFASFFAELENLYANNLQVIFTSSISVYKSNQGDIDEENGCIEPNSINFIAEEKLRTIFKNNLTVLRLGGLIGENRHPVFHLAGRTELPNGNAPVNLIQRDEIINIVIKIIDQKAFGHIFNCVFPSHPSKAKYYVKKAIEHNLIPPTFNSSNEIFKTVISKNVSQLLKYNFIHSI